VNDKKLYLVSHDALTAANAKVEKLRKDYRELLIQISNSHVASMGSISNVYVSQLDKTAIDKALADTEEK